MIPDKAWEILKSDEMLGLFEIAQQKKIISILDAERIYSTKLYARQVIEYFVRNKILKLRGNGMFEYIYQENAE